MIAIQNIIQTNFSVTTAFEKLIVYGDLMTVLILHLHAITVLMESYRERATQLQLITKLDEIEKIFAEKFHMKSNRRLLRRRFNKFIAFWLVKVTSFSVVLLLGPMLTSHWYNLYFLFVVFSAVYTSALNCAHWMVFVDVIRYNVERINVCLIELRDQHRIERWRPGGRIICVVGALPKDACEDDTYDRLVQLRMCYNITWQATRLVNRCFRWSFLIGVSNGLFLIVIGLYVALYGLLSLKMLPWHDVIVNACWTSLLFTDFLFTALICEDIDGGVSSPFRKVSICF